jgi:hypothetical protein
MPTPTFTFRLPDSERLALVEMAKLYGSPNPRAFLVEMVGAMCSGKPERVQDFNARLIRAAGEQLILKLNAPLSLPAESTDEGPARRVKPKKKRRRRRGTP